MLMKPLDDKSLNKSERGMSSPAAGSDLFMKDMAINMIASPITNVPMLFRAGFFPMFITKPTPMMISA